MNLKKGFDLYFYVEIGARIYCGFTTRIETKYEMKAVRCDAAIENYSRPKKKNSKFFPRYEFITLNGHALDFTIGRLDTQESFINELLDRDCLYKDDKINIIDSKMKEIILSIDKRYMEMCKDLFEL